MNEDFLDAHLRHWTDAELLYAAQRWANADHLYGISAECGLKGLTETFKNGPLAGKERRQARAGAEVPGPPHGNRS